MKILVIAMGYIGISSALYFTKAGVEVYGIDLDMEKLNQINLGKMPQKDLEKWLDFNPKKYLKQIKVSHNFTCLKNQKFDAIFIAVPTEKDGEPWFDALQEVIEKINKSKNKDSLVIVESTLTPGVSEKYIKPYLKQYVLSPRRDWFGSPEKTVTNLPRIVGGNTEKSTKNAIKLLKKICKILHPCTSVEAELVKAVENSQRHLGIIYTCQLAFAYPNLDIRKIMKLAGTKWNCIEYYPSLAVGGYCINLASKYVIVGAKGKAKNLTLLKNALKTDENMVHDIASRTLRKNPKKIAIIGISYLANIRVDILSAGSKLIDAFKDLNTKADIQVYDSLYSKSELEKKTKLKVLKFPQDLNKFDCVFIMTGHNEIKELNKNIWINKTKNCKFIFDNVGILKDIKFKCPYSLIGEAKWLEKI